MKEIINYITKKLRKKSGKTANKSSMRGISGKNSKKFLTADDSLSLESGQTFIKEEINAEAKEILKEAVKSPEVLVKFIKSKGTKVIKSRHMKTILFLFSEEEGFLPPMTGIKAFLFTLVINIVSPVKLDLGFKTPALFALGSKPVNIYFLSHQFHMWMSYVNELPGFDEKTRKNFKSVWDSVDSMSMSTMSIEEILSLKDAIARDKEAIDFVKEITRELIGQKQVLKKIKQGNRANI